MGTPEVGKGIEFSMLSLIFQITALQTGFDVDIKMSEENDDGT